MTTIDSKLQVLLSYKEFTLETLLQLKSQELRRVCIDAKLECYRDGALISRSSARKAELAQAIFTNAQVVANAQVDVEPAHFVNLQDEFRVTFESKYLTRFKDILIKYKTAEKLNDIDGCINTLASAQIAGTECVNHLYDEDKIGDTSVQVYKSALLSRIRRVYPNISLKDLDSNVEGKLFSYFRRGTNNQIKQLGIKKKVDNQAQENQNKRQELGIQRKVEIAPFLVWAKARLEKLPLLPLKNRDTSWREIALAVQLLTGRRVNEVMCTGKFEYVDDETVKFSGQLKKREVDNYQFEIKVLMKAGALIIPALEWLEKAEKRITPEIFNTSYLYENFRSAEKGYQPHRYVNARFSKDLGKEMKHLVNSHVILHSGDWVTPGVQGKGADVRVTHLLRQMYAKAYVLVYCGEFSSSSLDVVSSMLGKVLGHEANTTSVRNYTKDIYLTNEDEVAILKLHQ